MKRDIRDFQKWAGEQVMHRQVEYVLNGLESNEKIILMAGSLHLMKNDQKIKVPSGGAG